MAALHVWMAPAWQEILSAGWHRPAIRAAM